LIDTLTADATLADPATTASIDLVFPAPALPAGARIETAELRDGSLTADTIFSGAFSSVTISLVFPAFELPAGAIVDRAALRVAHVETSTDLSTFDLAAVVTPLGEGSTPTSIPSDRFTDHPGPELEEDRIDLGYWVPTRRTSGPG
jgi:hypothetical protein